MKHQWKLQNKHECITIVFMKVADDERHREQETNYGFYNADPWTYSINRAGIPFLI